MDENSPVHMHPSFLWAQQMATQRMVLALARVLDAEPEWRRQSTAQIQLLHDLMLNTPSSEIALHGLEQSLAWLATGANPPG